MYEVRSSVKEQLKFLESIDRHSAQCKQEQEREKLLKAAKVRGFILPGPVRRGSGVQGRWWCVVGCGVLCGAVWCGVLVLCGGV